MEDMDAGGDNITIVNAASLIWSLSLQFHPVSKDTSVLLF